MKVCLASSGAVEYVEYSYVPDLRVRLRTWHELGHEELEDPGADVMLFRQEPPPRRGLALGGIRVDATRLLWQPTSPLDRLDAATVGSL